MFGYHVARTSHIQDNKKSKTMLEAIISDYKVLPTNCIQIFVQGPRNSKMIKMDYIDIKNYCFKNNINLYVHSSYITVGIFNKLNNSILILEEQLKVCDILGAKGFVIHISNKTPSEIIKIFDWIIPVLKKYKTPFILEQPAKKPSNGTYETPAKINKLTKMINKKYDNWGWCIDLCHLWSAGIKTNEYTVLQKWLNDLKYPKKILLFHLNGGSTNIFNTGRDKHILVLSKNFNNLLTDSAITKESITCIINFAKSYKLDCILEINRHKSDNMNGAKKSSFLDKVIKTFDLLKKI